MAYQLTFETLVEMESIMNGKSAVSNVHITMLVIKQQACRIPLLDKVDSVYAHWNSQVENGSSRTKQGLVFPLENGALI